MARDSGVPDHSLRRRVIQLEREVERLANALETLRRPALNHTSPFRLAKTVADSADTPNYPDQNPGPANTFKIVFLDAHFTKTVGDRDLTENSRAASTPSYQSIGRTINGMWLPEGSIVGCLYQPPLDATKGYHWLFPIGGGFIGYIEYGDTITARANLELGGGLVTLYRTIDSAALITGKSLQSTGKQVMVLNCTKQTPASDEIFIQMKLSFDGHLYWDVDDCSGISDPA